MQDKVVIVNFVEGDTEVLEAPETNLECTYIAGTLFVEIRGNYLLNGEQMHQEEDAVETFYYPPHQVKRVNFNRKIEIA